MTQDAFEAEIERVRESMAISVIEGQLRHGSSKAQVLRDFRNPDYGFLHAFYKENGLAHVGRLIQEASEGAHVYGDPRR